MESSEDDAGTARNASRRASAREKDIGLAEDVNATSSFQQKSPEFRSPCQTAAMSEDNFDGDSVPSPSSQDVNTSTEAILDMIDEIVDGPGAPRRLPLSPDIVDALNEEVAETSNNLNIIQESAKSDVNISTVPEVASFVNSADSETPLPANTDAQASQAECSTPSDKSASIVKTDSVDTLPASSSLPESDEIAASTEPEVSVVSNVETGSSVSQPQSNIPSSSEEQTVQNIADNSVCESQDRTVKCVTSSDNRDNVTVESAESTSSDSSVSECKALLVEPQIRSPVRRRLVRPAPSDRRPDSTVSSTVDSQTVNISAGEQTISESITKDVTSSSDAVPTIHGNVKPEEISNVSEINFCKAETSMSPPKKIKLIRQKNITGTSNRETPLNQTNVLADKEQCQSTSSDNLSVKLPHSESSSTIRLSQSQDDSKKPSSDSNIVLDKIPESTATVSSEEHSQPSIKITHSLTSDESDRGKDSEKIISVEPSSQNPPESSINDDNSSSTEKAISSLSTSNLPESLTDKKINEIEQGNSCKMHDSQHKTLDYIPLTLPPTSNEVKSNSSKLKSISCELETREIEPKLKKNECEIQSMLVSKKSELLSNQNKTKTNDTALESSSINIQSNSSELESKISELESRNTKLEFQNSELESKSSELDSRSCELESKISELKSSNSVLQSRSDELEYKSSPIVLESPDNKAKSSSQLSSNSSEKISLSQPQTISTQESISSEILSKSISPESESSNLHLSSSEQVSMISENETKSSKPQAKVHPTSSEDEIKTNQIQSSSNMPESKSSISESSSADPVPSSSELQTRSNEAELQSSETQSNNIILESQTAEIDSKLTAPDPQVSEADPLSSIPEQSSNVPEQMSSEIESLSGQTDSTTMVSESCQPESKLNELTDSTTMEVVSESCQPESKLNELTYSTTLEVVSESGQPESNLNELRTNSSQPQSKIAKLESNSNLPDSKPAEIESSSSQPELKIPEKYSKSNIPDSKPAEIESSSSQPELKIPEISSKSNLPDSKPAEIKSSSSQPELKIPEIESKPAEIDPKSSQSEPKSAEVESKSNELVSQSVQPESQITVVKSQSSELELKDAKLVSKSSTLELINSEVEPMSIDSEPPSSDHSKGKKLPSKNLDKPSKPSESQPSVNCQPDTSSGSSHDHKKVPPFKLNLSRSSKSSQSESKPEIEHSSINKNNVTQEEPDCTKHIPKLTIKLKQPEEKSPVPKVTIKPLRPPVDQDMNEKLEDVPSVTKLNIKPLVKPLDNVKDRPAKSEHESKISGPEQLHSITKLNIKPILKPPEKINDIHRKSSSSEISESECSENDETTSTSDQTSASDNGSSEVIPKVTIKLGKPGTESEGKFYTEKNVPKLTIKGIQQDEKLIISQSEEVQPEKVPKLTIKTVTKTEGQPLSPKLTIKPLKPPDTPTREKVSNESFSQNTEGRESPHVPKITIKPVTRSDSESRTPKKSTVMCDSSEHIPVVTKLNIKPILKPIDSGESSEDFEEVPVVSKLNIKPVIKPKDNDVDSNLDDVPKITKLNIKPIKNPEENSSEDFKDCDELNADVGENSIPVVTKINIKPIIKPHEEEKEKDSENLSSETGNSSDDNNDHIPVVTKLNIKPIVNPDDKQDSSKLVSSTEQSIPMVTKLNIKPLVKPGQSSPSSPKKEHTKSGPHSPIPVVTKLNIKPVVRPEGTEIQKCKDESQVSPKHPPLVMKINMKSVTENVNHESSLNENTHSYIGDGLLSIAPKVRKMTNEVEKSLENKEHKSSEVQCVNDILETRKASQTPIEKQLRINCVLDSIQKSIENVDRSSINKKVNLNSPTTRSRLSEALQKQHSPKKTVVTKCDSVQSGSPHHDSNVAKEGKLSVPNETHIIQANKNVSYRSAESTETSVKQSLGRQKTPAIKNCTLLKKLLENTRDNMDKNLEISPVVNCGVPVNRSESTLSACKNIKNSDYSVEPSKSLSGITASRNVDDNLKGDLPQKVNDLNKSESVKLHPIKQLSEKVNENVSNPLEITISDKITNQGSGQDSPRIILKINKTDHGSSAKIITDEVKRPDTPQNYVENTQDDVNDKQSPKKYISNSRKKQALDAALNLSAGKRLRSSRIVENTEKSQGKKNVGKRPSTETTPPQNKEAELSMLQTKRLKLGQLLSGNKSLPITPVLPSQTSPTKINPESKPVKTVNHSLLNNENCSKNGNSKLHNILSNLQAKQKQTLAFNNTNCSEIVPAVPSDLEFNASMSSSDTVEIAQVESSHPELQQMIINENSDFRDYTAPEEVSQDPLEVDSLKTTSIEAPVIVEVPQPLPVQLTPQPKKRGRPRKIPLSEGAKPVVVPLPVPALEERPQRSLRLMRDRPAILQKPRGGRGRGRGGRRSEATPPAEPETVTIIETVPDEPTEERPTVEIDPMSSRIKLPRMTEALDKMPSVCQTPLTSRRRNSSGTFSVGDTPELKSILDSTPPKDEFPNTPEPCGSGRPKAGPGSRGGRGRTPRGRGRGRGRGGGRGAMYMKETMGIYGRVCGPATTTVQLFEEETCMMDDNATPAKPSHLLDEDSQSSVKSSTNESSKMKKSKFADLFDSKKVWTAADVKEYTWPPYRDDAAQKVMMIQEQVAMFLGVKSFKRRYPELQRRTIGGEERDFVLSKGLVTEALCDLGITAVDASEVLDIMLSDYPHKYEEFRSYQRQRQLTETSEETIEEPKPEEKPTKIEFKAEKPVETKPELPKVDPEKARQEMAAAAIASAAEWNARANASRRGACVDLQSHTVQRPRAPPAAPRRAHVRPPAGFYPHALLPGQYQHSYRLYTPEQLRYFPLNTVLAAPPAPPSVTESSSESEPDWGSRCSSSDDSDGPTHHSAKRKKLTKVKRSSAVEAGPSGVKEEVREEELCRVCKLRLEANRRYTHERFLVCANCNAKLHPGCVDLNADTIRKCREYPWQCAECKSCCSCRLPKDDDKMLFCDLCDRGFHIYCVGLDAVPSGRWHCVECAVCKSCGARTPGGPAGAAGAGPGAAGPGAAGAGEQGAAWHHQTRRGPGGHKVYSHSLCTPCARVR